jgi:hypothetical protein
LKSGLIRLGRRGRSPAPASRGSLDVDEQLQHDLDQIVARRVRLLFFSDIIEVKGINCWRSSPAQDLNLQASESRQAVSHKRRCQICRWKNQNAGVVTYIGDKINIRMGLALECSTPTSATSPHREQYSPYAPNPAGPRITDSLWGASLRAGLSKPGRPINSSIRGIPRLWLHEVT